MFVRYYLIDALLVGTFGLLVRIFGPLNRNADLLNQNVGSFHF